MREKKFQPPFCWEANPWKVGRISGLETVKWIFRQIHIKQQHRDTRSKGRREQIRKKNRKTEGNFSSVMSLCTVNCSPRSYLTPLPNKAFILASTCCSRPGWPKSRRNMTAGIKQKPWQSKYIKMIQNGNRKKNKYKIEGPGNDQRPELKKLNGNRKKITLLKCVISWHILGE